MALFSPAKMLVVFVVALMVLGPDKLPKVARQIGALWNELRKLGDRLDSEVRGTLPDLPSTRSMAEAVRSPLRFVDQMARTDDGGAPAPPGRPGEGTRGLQGDGESASAPRDPTGPHHEPGPPSLP